MAEKKDSFMMNAARYTAIATSLPGAILAGYLIGAGLDRWLKTTYLTIVFLVIGIIAGFAELVREILHNMNSKS